MAEDLSAILQSPEWFPFRLTESGDVTFIRLSRSERLLATFLHENNINPGAPRVTLSLAAIDEACSLPQANLHFLFHTAFCCSTLMVHALDSLDNVIGFSEPQILNDLGTRAIGGQLDQGLLIRVLSLFCLKGHGTDHCVIKPTNELNFLIPALMKASPQSRALLLSSDLDDFLYSIARKGLPGRAWVRGQYCAVRRRTGLTLGFSESEISEHTDMQVAALFWLQNRALFQAATRGGCDRFASLGRDDISLDLENSVSRTAQFFNISISPEELCRVRTQGQRDIKRVGSRYDPTERQRQRSALQEFLGAEIDLVQRWASGVADHAGIITMLPASV